MGVDEKSANAKRDKLPWTKDDPRYHGQILGTPQEAVARIGEYVDAGAQQVNLAMRAPFDMEALQAFIEEVIPAFSA
jgi:alkanesulfonate monooxygenase SsuD/methylene tetrahydromethanopterin reductase-like flavin-dependent oxidoreductase (luciferase family)